MILNIDSMATPPSLEEMGMTMPQIRRDGDGHLHPP